MKSYSETRLNTIVMNVLNYVQNLRVVNHVERFHIDLKNRMILPRNLLNSKEQVRNRKFNVIIA
jgi:hypothetical protein